MVQLFSGRFESPFSNWPWTRNSATEKPNIWTSNSFLISYLTKEKKSSFLIWDLFLLETPLITFNVINTELPSFELDGLSFQQKRSRSPLIIPEMPFIGSSPAYHQCARIRVPSSLKRFLPFNKWNLYL